jgi:hypothetical protein
MKLAEKSHRKIEEFFREYLAEESFRLPEIYFYGGKFTHYLTVALKIEGITIGKRVYIFPKNFWFSETRKLRLNEVLVVHEVTHVLQYAREGFFKFLWLYVKSYYSNLRKKKKWDWAARSEAYFEIPFEIEARQAASKFVAWSKNRKIS